ncbi:MAG: hypothetical protein Q7K39_00045 [Candidatus Magasanikbacteria bacterium]|nr:hypothetical protein [Candidatus Magasanikbacteria bacterium]
MTKPTLFLLAAAAVTLTMGAGCAKFGSNNQTNSDYNSPSYVAVTSTDASDELAVTAAIEPGVEVIKTSTGTFTAVTKSYATALGIYAKSGLRFQFSKCSGTPGSLYIKQGVKFMIDNRDNTSHQIGIGPKTYTLGAYNFAIVSVQKAGSYNITCDGGGAAHVTVEK